jgi:hypothetical protein
VRNRRFQGERREIDLEEQYCAVVREVFPAFGGEAWVYDAQRRAYRRVTEPLAAVLPLAARFRTLAGHRQALLQAGWQDDGSDYLGSALRELIEQGLLRSRTDFLRNVASAAGSGEEPPEPIASLAWVTRERPELLRRSVESFIAGAAAYRREVSFSVFDDSPGEGDREATRAMLAELGRSRGVPIRYAGLEEKRAFASLLVREAQSEGATEELLDFALFDPFGVGYAVGANSNALLLGTLGERTVLLNDDAFCRFASPPAPEVGLHLSSAQHPMQLRFFGDRASLQGRASFVAADILGAHESLLGRSVAGCLRAPEAAAGVDCAEITPAFLRLLEGGGCRVLVTMTGACGDSGMGSPRFVLSLEGENREELIHDEQRYREAFRSREVLHVVPAPTISDSPLLMALNCGLDNRELLPPLFPVLRNGEGVWAQILRQCWPSALVGHLPLATLHEPPEARRFAEEEATRISIRLPDLLILLVGAYQPGAGWLAGARALEALGSYLARIGALPLPRFEELLRSLWVAEMSRYGTHLEELLLLHGGEPDYWAEDVESHLEAIRKRVAGGPRLGPEDVAERVGEEGALAACQAMAARYGQLLEAWPALIQAARRLQAAGTTIFGSP